MDRVDASSVDLAGQWEKGHQKITIAPDLESGAPKEYYEMLASLKKGKEWTGPASAVRGFHFPPRPLENVVPHGNEIYFFPERPNVFQANDIGKLPSSASGWNRRNLPNRDLGVPDVVFCCAIVPDDENANVQVTVKPNADYFGLMGLRVIVDNSAKWKVVDRNIAYPASE